jgi:hypothetical protein
VSHGKGIRYQVAPRPHGCSPYRIAATGVARRRARRVRHSGLLPDPQCLVLRRRLPHARDPARRQPAVLPPASMGRSQLRRAQCCLRALLLELRSASGTVLRDRAGGTRPQRVAPVPRAAEPRREPRARLPRGHAVGHFAHARRHTRLVQRLRPRAGHERPAARARRAHAPHSITHAAASAHCSPLVGPAGPGFDVLRLRDRRGLRLPRRAVFSCSPRPGTTEARGTRSWRSRSSYSRRISHVVASRASWRPSPSTKRS